METQHFSIFSEKQIEAIKSIIRNGAWGDTDMEFGDNKETNYAYGFFTNRASGRTKEFSGICSGISKKIKESNCKAVKMVSDWWGDGKSGDMMFFNIDLLGTSRELFEWSES